MDIEEETKGLDFYDTMMSKRFSEEVKYGTDGQLITWTWHSVFMDLEPHQPAK